MKFSKVLSDKQKAELYNSDFKQNLLDQNLPVNQKNIAKVLNDMFPEWVRVRDNRKSDQRDSGQQQRMRHPQQHSAACIHSKTRKGMPCSRA